MSETKQPPALPGEVRPEDSIVASARYLEGLADEATDPAAAVELQRAAFLMRAVLQAWEAAKHERDAAIRARDQAREIADRLERERHEAWEKIAALQGGFA